MELMLSTARREPILASIAVGTAAILAVATFNLSVRESNKEATISKVVAKVLTKLADQFVSAFNVLSEDTLTPSNRSVSAVSAELPL